MSVQVIDTLKPKNNGAFPIAEATDIAVTSEKRLPEALADKADVSALAETNATVASKANTADVESATANLQGQINQIEISASSEAVVAPEVAAARVGDDGTEYSTLKERLDTENASMATTIDALKTGADLSNFIAGYYITENGLTEAADCIVSNPIVPQSRSITWINGNVTAGGRGKLVEFKSDDTVNGAWGSNGTNERTFTIKDDTAYIRATFFKEYSSSDGIQYASGQHPYFYKPNSNIIHGTEELFEDIQDASVDTSAIVHATLKERLDSDFTTLSTDISHLKTGLHDANYTVDCYINAEGELIEDDERIVSDPITPLSRTITWVMRNVGTGGRGRLVEFKSDDTVNTSWSSNGMQERTLTIKEDTAYIRASFFKDYASTDGLKYGSGTQEYFYKPTKTGVYGTDELFEITQQQKSELEILSDSVENLEVKEYVVPDYYEDHIASKIEEIRTNMMDVGRNGETFVFITDLHWENNNKNSPALVARLLDELNINLLVCGGDLINQSTNVTLMEQTMNLCVRSFNFKNTFFPCAFGNHDNNSNMGLDPQYHFTTDGVYALMQKQAENHVIYTTTDKFNFYFDVSATKTRFIVCDTGTNGDFNKYDELTALLNTTPNGYKVIIVAHWLMQNNVKSTFANNLEIIIDAFNSRETCTIDGTSRDFTNANGEIVCAIAGHAHYDDSWSTTDGIPFIITDCDCGARTNNTDYPYVSGTITEQAFDVVTIDYVNRTIKCTRIGRGSDRTIEY
jgi:hypothetical protein